MNNVAQFIKIREQIESYANNISKLLGQGTAGETRLMLDKAAGLLTELTAMVDNDIQVIAVGRLTRLLNTLRAKVTSVEKKKGTAKKSRARNVNISDSTAELP